MEAKEATEATVGSLNIAQLMQVPEPNHDMRWLVNALHAAIKLELATLPPYLFAFWSIKDNSTYVAQGIREVALQEMLHMATACNLLVAIGGSPMVNTPSQVPIYPGPLPDGVRPGLIVQLAGFSQAQTKVFMDIELPEHGPIALLVAAETYSTIGAFYTAVQTAFERLRPPLSANRQFADYLGLKKVLTLADVQAAIQLIKRQGEGSTSSPYEQPDELAHYYRFGEMYNRKRLIFDPVTRRWRYAGADVPMPAVWPVDPIPTGGYRRQDVPPAVWTLLAACDTAFTTMLNQIAGAWQTGNADLLNAAIGSMFGLADPAKQLMQIRKPSGPGNYGPCFRFVPAA